MIFPYLTYCTIFCFGIFSKNVSSEKINKADLKRRKINGETAGSGRTGTMSSDVPQLRGRASRTQSSHSEDDAQLKLSNTPLSGWNSKQLNTKNRAEEQFDLLSRTTQPNYTNPSSTWPQRAAEMWQSFQRAEKLHQKSYQEPPTTAGTNQKSKDETENNRK